MIPSAHIDERTKRFPRPKRTAPMILKMGCCRSAMAGDADIARSKLH